MLNDYEVSEVAKEHNLNLRTSMCYGYILEIIRNEEEEQLYLALVMRERMARNPELPGRTAIMPIDGHIDFLTSTFGSPDNLLGRRCRIIYTGNSWRRGVAQICFDRNIRNAAASLEIPNRGFRYAIPGGGNV